MDDAHPASMAPESAAVRVSLATWWAIGVLAAVSFLNYMDRMVLAVLLEPIKAELKLSDSQLGLLSGLAFAVFYATLGIPIARLADRTSRTRLLALCVTIWSGMTAATGAANSFAGLFLARVGVGVGEAGCVPAAHSLIGDYLPGPRRALGISIFQAGGLAGLSGGLILTGLLADQLGWRPALYIVGLSGLPLAALILLTLREPPRLGPAVSGPTESARTALAALLARPALRQLVLALSIGAFATYGLTQWLPAFFIRVHGLTLTQIGLWSGTAAGIGGVLGVMLGGWLGTRLIHRDPRWELWLPAIAYGGSAPLYAAVFLAPSPIVAIVIKVVATFLAASGGGVALSAIQSFAEPHRRATAVSLTLFLSSLLGLGLGPWLVGVASDLMAPAFGRESLRYALLISTAALLWAGLHFMLAARRAVQDRLT